MAGQKLEPMSVNSGDPITAELMQNIIANINIVNSLATGTTTTPTTPSTGGYGAPATPTVSVTESNRLKVSCKKDSTGGPADPIYFTKTFSKAPNIALTVMNTSGKTLTSLKYLPVVTSVTSTEFTFKMLSIGATAEGQLTVTWIASI